MPGTHSAIIADTSCLILLVNVGRLEVLQKIYGHIITTPEIAAEFGEAMPVWIEVRSVADRARTDALVLRLDRGEASAIALALETKGCLVILDDMKARRVANELGLDYTGTLGVVIKAKQEGFISEAAPLLHALREAGLWITDEVFIQTLHQCGESATAK